MNNEKNIFMVVNYTPADQSIGVTKKIKSVIDAFIRKGYSVYYSAYSSQGIEIFNYKNEIVYKTKCEIKNDFLLKIIRRFYLLNTCTRYMKMTSIKFDIVFLRYLGFDKAYVKLLKTCKDHGAYIMVDMLGYFQGMKSRDIKGMYMNTNTNIFYKKAIRYIDEILTEGCENTLFGRKTVQAQMGVETDKLREHTYTGSKKQINLISVANETIYHGYDRLINSLAMYYKGNSPEIIINTHLVGVISDETQRLIISNGLSEHVILYGKLYGDKLMDIYEKCNMAVGPLGQHRIGGKRDTGLKTKEYFGVGIPYFYAGMDSTVPEKYPFVFQIPSDESMIDFSDIIRFYNSYKNLNDVASNMRQFARENFSWDKITDSFLTNYNKNSGE